MAIAAQCKQVSGLEQLDMNNMNNTTVSVQLLSSKMGCCFSLLSCVRGPTSGSKAPSALYWNHPGPHVGSSGAKPLLLIQPPS